MWRTLLEEKPRQTAQAKSAPASQPLYYIIYSVISVNKKNLAMARTLWGRICFLRIKRIIDAKLGVMGKTVDGVVLVDE